jgi:hypothetical protein
MAIALSTIDETTRGPSDGRTDHTRGLTGVPNAASVHSFGDTELGVWAIALSAVDETTRGPWIELAGRAKRS